MMNRKVAQWVVLASLTGAFALVPVLAAAQASPATEGEAHHKHPGRPGVALIHAALKLDSLTSEQRSAIEALRVAEHDAAVPVHAAEAHVLTALAGQVEAGSINPQAVAPEVQAASGAEASARAVALDAMQKLHDVLTPAQRDQLVSPALARMVAHEQAGPARQSADGHAGPLAHWSAKLGLSAGQQSQIEANLKGSEATPDDAGGRQAARAARQRWLESFRGAAFKASEAAPIGVAQNRNARLEHLLEAAVPVLTPAQRTQVAAELRERAAHGPHARGEHA